MLGKFGTLIAAHKLAAGIIIGTVAVGGTAGGVVVHNHVQAVKEEKIEEQRVAEAKAEKQTADNKKQAALLDSRLKELNGFLYGEGTNTWDTTVNAGTTAVNARIAEIQGYRKTYDALSKEAKSYVKNYDMLQKFEKDYPDQLKKAQGYDATAADFDKRVDELGDAEAITADKEATVTALLNEYNGYSDAIKVRVTDGGNTIKSMSDKIGQLKAETAKQAQIQAQTKASTKAGATKNASAGQASAGSASAGNTNTSGKKLSDAEENAQYEQRIAEQEAKKAAIDAKYADVIAFWNNIAATTTDEEYAAAPAKYPAEYARYRQYELEWAQVTNPNAHWEGNTLVCS